MRIEICQSYEALSLKAKEIVTSELGQHKALTLCAATGGSPTRMYELLVEEASRQPELFSQFTVLKLDEWGGIPMDHPGTCESYLRNYFVGPLQIPEDRYIAFQSDPENPEAECERIQQILDQKGPIDICILGIGMNGHIALNEPAPSLHTNCHVAHLSQKSLQHPMIAGDTEKPGYGLTLGMANIFQSRLIILLINGIKKREITQAFLEQKISTELSFYNYHEIRYRIRHWRNKHKIYSCEPEWRHSLRIVGNHTIKRESTPIIRYHKKYRTQNDRLRPFPGLGDLRNWHRCTFRSR